MQSENVDSSWMFVVLLSLIIGPFLFYLISLFIAWIKWLFITKEKLNASYSEIKDIKMPLSDVVTFNYKIGLDSKIDLTILDYNYNKIKTLINEKVNNGNHKIEVDTTSFSNGQYFLQLQTENQKISKLIDIQN